MRRARTNVTARWAVAALGILTLALFTIIIAEAGVAGMPINPLMVGAMIFLGGALVVIFAWLLLFGNEGEAS